MSRRRQTARRDDDTSGLTRFTDRTCFDFGQDDTDAGEPIIDSQMAASNLHVHGTNATQDPTFFGVNFADGRIKRDGLDPRGQDKTLLVTFVRGDTGCGVNDLAGNDDGTVTDATTGLVWAPPTAARPVRTTWGWVWSPARCCPMEWCSWR